MGEAEGAIGRPRRDGGARARVAVVEEEPIIGALCRRILERHGFEVAAGYGGHDAIELRFAEPAPDLMVIDWRMRDLNGDEAIARIRERERREALERVPIILETANPDGARKTGVEINVEAILAKPFTADELGSVVERVLRASRSGTSPRRVDRREGCE